jgi:spermidine synthase
MGFGQSSNGDSVLLRFLPGSRSATGEAGRADRQTALLCVLFFFSGFPALIYQLVWQRALFTVFGVNIESVTIVVTAFMLGLGLGSLAGGWLSKQRRIAALPLLASIECLTGLFGTVSLGVFDRIGSLALGMPLPVTALVTLALVAVPTLLMGATLPILVGHLVSRSGNVGHSVGKLYYVNTLGAGCACLLSTVLIFPFTGMHTAVFIAAAINAAVALGAVFVYMTGGRSASTVPFAPAQGALARSTTLRFGPVMMLAFAGGFISLSYEIFLVRTISYAQGGAASAFALTLSAFLVGLASGSANAAQWCDAADTDGKQAVVVNIIKANVVGFLFLPLLAHLGWAGQGMVAIALVLVYLLARYWGALLPCLAHFGIAADERAGSQTAWIYFANILGSASGGILTGFVLMDHIGLVGIAATLVAGGLVCALLCALALAPSPRTRYRHLAWALGGSIVAMASLPALSSGVLETLMWKNVPGKQPFTSVVENRSGIITVDRTGAVFGNGMYDGRFNTDLVHDTNGAIRPFALSLFHRDPGDVLMIGLASASWAQIIANNPEVRSLTVVEINPGYLQLIARGAPVASVLHNPKVHIVIDDGRRWLRLHPERKFDAIVSNTTWYFRSNAATLLSVEFLDLAKAHLNSGGIFFYNTTDSARVQRTACEQFPYGARFANHMLVSTSPLVWDLDNWRRTLAAYSIDGKPVFDLAGDAGRKQLDELVRAMQGSVKGGAGNGGDRFIESCSSVLKRTAGYSHVTDDNMGSEWRHTLRME